MGKIASLKVKGTVKFIFQPAEEGAPEGEEGGQIDGGGRRSSKSTGRRYFGLHINAQTEVGQIKWPKGTMAASDWFNKKIMGKQTHGAYPWLGIDPIVTASQIVLGLQTIVSRNKHRIRSCY
jgi:metal-dependent amidase/aminoacylase/carboxypeptidase family protein